MIKKYYDEFYSYTTAPDGEGGFVVKDRVLKFRIGPFYKVGPLVIYFDRFIPKAKLIRV